MEGAKLLQNSISMRLSMFTRRVKHKHNLNANNVGFQMPVSFSSAPNSAIDDIAESMLTLQPKNKETCITSTSESKPTVEITVQGVDDEVMNQRKNTRVLSMNGKEEEVSKANRKQSVMIAGDDVITDSKKRARDGEEDVVTAHEAVEKIDLTTGGKRKKM